MHKQQGWLEAWEYCQAKLIQTLVRAHKEWTEAGVSASRVTTLRRLQEKGYQATSEPETTSEASYLGCEKRTQWSKVLFSDESKFCISFGNQGPRVWRKSGEAQNPCCLKSCVKFPQSVMIWAAMSSAGVGPLCFLSPQSTQPSTRKFLEHFHASFCWQALWRCWFHFPAGLGTCPHCQRYQKLVQWPWYYCAWLASNSPDLNPIENLWGIVKRKMRDTRPNNADELKATVKETWASIPPQQCHKLITSMPRRIEAVIKAKGALPSIEYIYSKLTYFPEGQQFTIFFFFIGLMKYSNLLR